MNITLKRFNCLLFFMLIFFFNVSIAQTKSINIYTSTEKIKLDGLLNEPIWNKASFIDHLIMVEPDENAPASYKTEVRIISDDKNIYFGIKCFDDPEKITAYTKVRDAELDGEDYIKIVLDTYLDKRNGYIFAVNPFGARYDAVISRRGEDENKNWDGVWEAKTSFDSLGWTAEIVIPVKTMSFGENLNSWGFNIERRIERLLEIDRWTAINQNQKVSSLNEEGIINGINKFDLGKGLLIKLSPLAGFNRAFKGKINWEKDFSADLTKRITPDISATVTVNTDFAETEVDTRKTNLTRFPLFFPEKRTFFLEGADIYDFGLGMRRDIIPFFSRRIGLYEGEQVPIIAGTKLNGKIGKTNFGGMYIRTGKSDLLPNASDMGVVRIKRNLFKQSN
ncbi:MAG: hypothetical protein D6707_11715, partial [Bacteroidetes bacterium]